MIHSFLEAGIKQDGIAFHITAEPKALKDLLNEHPSTFYLFLCNPKPKIKLVAERNHKAGVTIIIKDNGPGIPEENLDKIFVPFYSTKAKGSGIGLSLSRQIMKLHRGRIDVETEPGAGTTFILEF